MDKVSIPITLPDYTVVDGHRPLVLVGANGSGKTRLGAQMALQSGYDRIPAHREGAIADQHGMQTFEQANSERLHYAGYKRDPQGRANDIGFIYGELLAEQLAEQLAYAQRGKADANPGLLAESRLERSARLWEVLFPGRSLKLDYSPQVFWRDSEMRSPLRTMSDGELSGLYLVLRLTIADPGVIIVDEPELHLHPVLARHFWDAVELLRSDCRFVYLTHDYSFALSRQGNLGIVQNEHKVKLVPSLREIPADLVENLIGSAALSVVARRIVFCEGEREKSIDSVFYSAWFDSKDTIVVPVKNCEAVRRAFKVFRENALISNANAVAIVERDYWSPVFLSRLSDEGLTVLEFHELEGLFCTPAVFNAVADYLAIKTPEKLYAALLQDVRNNFRGLRLQQLIIERAKRDAECRLVGLLNKAHATDSLDQTRLNFTKRADISQVIPDVGQLFDEHAEIVTKALAGDAFEILQIVPSKDVMGRLLTQLGLASVKAYTRIISNALTKPPLGEGHEQDNVLRARLIEAFSPYLPPRKFAETTSS